MFSKLYANIQAFLKRILEHAKKLHSAATKFIQGKISLKEYLKEEKEETDLLSTQHELEEKLLGVHISQKPHVRFERVIGLWLIVVFFGGFGVWAYVSPLESAAVAPGKIIVAGNRRTIQHLEGGIVSKIHVKDGSIVAKGSLLISLEETSSSALLQLSSNEVLELLAIEARLLAEIHEKNNIAFSKALSTHLNQEKVKQIIHNQQDIFNANKKTFSSNLGILHQQIEQSNEQIKGLQAQQTANLEQLSLIKNELVDVKKLYARRLIERSRVLALQREEANLIGEKGALIAQIAEIKQKMGETNMQILTLHDNLKKELFLELRDTQKNLTDAQEKEKTVADVLTRTEIRSPIAGVIVGLNIHTIGGVIKSGEPLMDIVPQHEQLIVEARVNPIDIDVVHKGLMAKIVLTALNVRTMPILVGEVIHVSADTFQDEKTGDTFYKAKVAINTEELNKIGEKTLYPGMFVDVMIVTAKLTPWEYITLPIKRSFYRAFRES